MTTIQINESAIELLPPSECVRRCKENPNGCFRPDKEWGWFNCADGWQRMITEFSNDYKVVDTYKSDDPDFDFDDIAIPLWQYTVFTEEETP